MNTLDKGKVLKAVNALRENYSLDGLSDEAYNMAIRAARDSDEVLDRVIATIKSL